MMHFPPVSDYTLFSNIFLSLSKIFNLLPFPEEFLDFHPSKFLMTFFSHRPQILNFLPYFPCFSTFPTCFAKIIISPYFGKFPPVLDKFTCILHALRVFPPYFGHDAFMHHPMHVLDALVSYNVQENKMKTLSKVVCFPK